MGAAGIVVGLVAMEAAALTVETKSRKQKMTSGGSGGFIVVYRDVESVR